MMMRMLEAGGLPVVTDNMRAADEDNPYGYYELEQTKRLDRDAAWLVDAHGKAVKVVYRLLYHLPKEYRYRVVFMDRNLEEVLVSQWEMLQRRGEEGGTLDDTQFAKAFRVQLQQLDAWLPSQGHLPTLHVNYHDVVFNPEREVHRVSAFLGLTLDTDAMAGVLDPALYRHRR
jgi:hypothetical protein